MTQSKLLTSLLSCSALVALAACGPAAGRADSGPEVSTAHDSGSSPQDSGQVGECAMNSDCVNFPTAPVCDTQTSTCVQCNSNTDCTTSVAPVCDTVTNMCTTMPSSGCHSDTDCSGATPACNTGTGACVQCSAGNTSQCTTGQSCVGGQCVVNVTNNDAGMMTNHDAGMMTNHDAGMMMDTDGGSPESYYCKANCQSDSDCGGTDNDAGVSSNGNYCLCTDSTCTTTFCGSACTGPNDTTNCPSTATCATLNADGGAPYNCAPTSGTCTMGTFDAGPPGSIVTVPLTGCPFLGFDAPVKINTQTFELDVDTGSTTTFVADTACTNCDVTPLWNPSAGTATGQAADSTYGSGSVTGKEYSDKVQVGTEMPVVTMNFGAITSQRGFFLKESCSGTAPLQQGEGILGMGPLDLSAIGGNNPTNADAYFTDLVASMAGVANVFAVNLCSANGNIWFGGYDTGYASGPAEYTPMVPMSGNNVYWQLNISSIGIGGTAIASSAAPDTIIDTGTGVILMPAAAYNGVVKAVGMSAGNTSVFGGKLTSTFFSQGSCVSAAAGKSQADVDAALPPLTVTMPNAAGGSFTLSMPASQSYLTPMTGQYCASITNGGGMNLWGAPGLRAYITIFDEANKKIGFAPQMACK